MKKLTALILAGAITLSLAACGGNNGAGSGGNGGSSGTGGNADDGKYAGLAPVTLTGATSASPGAAGEQVGLLIAEKLDAITGGQLVLDYYTNGDLGDDATILRNLQNNDIQLVIAQTAPYVAFVPDTAVFDLPMVFAQYDAATIDKVLNGDSEFNQKLGESFNNAGMQLMGILQGATFRLTTANRDLSSLSDFNGMLIRTMENNNHMAFWKALGAQPSPMTWSDVYFALQSRNIEAEENAADTIVGANLHEVQDYLACTNHILYANVISMNKDAWDSLDPLYQEALEQAIREALAEIGAELANIDAENKTTLCENSGSNNMTLIEYDNDFFAEVLALPAVQDLYKNIDSQVNGLGTILQNELAG